MATDPRAERPPATPQRATANGRRRSRFRERNVLLNPVSVIAASLAAFLATLALLTARFTGQHQAVGVGALVGQVAGTGGAVALTTRASGATATPSGAPSSLNGTAIGSGATPGAQPRSAALVTSTSGGATARGSLVGGDDGA